jgi:hypothetical protein
LTIDNPREEAMQTSTQVISSRAARIVIAVLALCALVDWFRPRPAFSQPAKAQATYTHAAEPSANRSAREFVVELGPVAFSLRVNWLRRG